MYTDVMIDIAASGYNYMHVIYINKNYILVTILT
jgi:hypothetical protein